MSKSSYSGQCGEAMACHFLEMCGYRCLARRYRMPGGEVDLIMTRGHQVVFIEVKTRAAEGPADPEHFFSRKQLARIRKVASAWLAEHPQPGKWIRLDVVTVQYSAQAGWARLEHFPHVGGS